MIAMVSDCVLTMIMATVSSPWHRLQVQADLERTEKAEDPLCGTCIWLKAWHATV